MGVKDIVEKRLEDYADVFADIVNVLLFHGKEVLKPGDLLDVVVRQSYSATGEINEIERDVAKSIILNGTRIALIGIENQTAIAKDMPVRIIGYDGASYRQQIRDKDDIVRGNTKKKENDEKSVVPCLYPVLTIVLYFGNKRWDGPIHLYDCFDIPEDFKHLINDYKIHVFEIAHLDEKTIGLFKSDFRYVAEYFVSQRKLSSGELDRITFTEFEMRHVSATLDLLRTFSGDKRWDDMYNNVKKGGTVDMFSAFDYYEQRGRKYGFSVGTDILRRVYAVASAEERVKLMTEGDDYLRMLAEKYNVLPKEQKSEMTVST